MLGKDHSSFTCESLQQITISNQSQKFQSNLLRSISNMHYLVSRSEIVLVTIDHNFCSYSISTKKEVRNGNELLKATRQIIGCNDDILDIAIISNKKVLDEIENGENNDDTTGDVSKMLAEEREKVANVSEVGENIENKEFLLALVTNSPQIRLMDQSFG
jgi:hypothetical protein